MQLNLFKNDLEANHKGASFADRVKLFRMVNPTQMKSRKISLNLVMDTKARFIATVKLYTLGQKIPHFTCSWREFEQKEVLAAQLTSGMLAQQCWIAIWVAIQTCFKGRINHEVGWCSLWEQPMRIMSVGGFRLSPTPWDCHCLPPAENSPWTTCFWMVLDEFQ